MARAATAVAPLFSPNIRLPAARREGGEDGKNNTTKKTKTKVGSFQHGAGPETGSSLDFLLTHTSFINAFVPRGFRGKIALW